MVQAISSKVSLKFMLAATAALGLAACGSESPQEYETDVTDQSGGELMVEDPNTVGVDDVQIPETPMTNVPADEAGAPPAANPAAPAAP